MIRLILILLFLAPLISLGQKRPKGLKRTVINVGIGTMATGNKIFSTESDKLFYNPKTGILAPKVYGIHVPVEIGINYAVTKRFATKFQFGVSRIWSIMGKEGTGSVQYWKNQEYHPWIMKDFTIGFQFSNKKMFSRYKSTGVRREANNYYQPAVRSYFEFEYIHSFLDYQTEYFHDDPNIQVGFATFGFYKNFFFQNSKNFMLYAGMKGGIRVVQFWDQKDYIPQNTEGTRDIDDSYNALLHQSQFVNWFQVKVGCKYVLPF